jgi:polyphosphate glucokinase
MGLFMKLLVIDIGGTHVKMLASDQTEARCFDSDRNLAPNEFIEKARNLAQGWAYDAVSLGFPGLVGKDGPRAEPRNLGKGWVGFDFAAAFGKPVKVINDAAMQALGSYEGERMLFLGLGTSVGSTLIADGVIVPMELGQLSFRDATVVAYLSKDGLEKRGKAEWNRAVSEVGNNLKKAFAADYLVLGGGHAELVETLPEGTRRGSNENAFEGGFRMWQHKDWKVVC